MLFKDYVAGLNQLLKENLQQYMLATKYILSETSMKMTTSFKNNL